jgi:hypothetical protein
MRTLRLVTGLLLAAAGPTTAQDRALVRFRVSTSALYESNLEHAALPRAAYGGVAALGVRMQDRDRRPRFTLDVETALHRYSTATRFERASLATDGGVTLGVANWLTWETELSVSLRGSSEDRDLNNQFQVRERLELRLARGTALRLTGSARLKRYPERGAAGRNATNRYAEAEFLQRLQGGGRLAIGARLEGNAAAAARYRYDRVTWGLELESAPDRWQRLELDLAYRVQRYTTRLVEDRSVLRRDYRLNPAVRWSVRPWSTAEITLAYDYENRSSNDPDEAYDAHRLSLGVTQWW